METGGAEEQQSSVSIAAHLWHTTIKWTGWCHYVYPLLFLSLSLFFLSTLLLLIAKLLKSNDSINAI